MASPAQLPLMMRDVDRAILASARVRSEARAVAEDIGVKALASDWGVTEKVLLLKLDQRDRHYLKPDEWMDLILRDRRGIILAAIADVAGYETPERKRVLDPGEKLARLEAQLDATLGADVAELVRRKAGLL